jgi:hypothetical protein
MKRFGMTLVALALATLAQAKEPGGAVLELAGPNEPGERMVVAGRIWKADGSTSRATSGCSSITPTRTAITGRGPRSTAPQGTRDARLSAG